MPIDLKEIKENTTTVVNNDMHNIDRKTLTGLIDSMANNRTVKQLTLSKCHLTDNDAIKLLKSLEKSRSVEMLDLSHNNLDNFFRELPGFVTKIPLTDLNVDGIKLSEKSISYLNKAVENSHTIKFVMPYNVLNPQSIAKINHATVCYYVDSVINPAIAKFENETKVDLSELKVVINKLKNVIDVPSQTKHHSPNAQSKPGLFNQPVSLSSHAIGKLNYNVVTDCINTIINPVLVQLETQKNIDLSLLKTVIEEMKDQISIPPDSKSSKEDQRCTAPLRY